VLGHLWLPGHPPTIETFATVEYSNTAILPRQHENEALTQSRCVMRAFFSFRDQREKIKPRALNGRSGARWLSKSAVRAQVGHGRVFVCGGHHKTHTHGTRQKTIAIRRTTMRWPPPRPIVYRPPPKNDQEKRNFYWPCLCVCVLEQFAEFLFRRVADGPRLMETKSSGRAFIDAAGHE
jgi:hypothetical protein